MGANDNFSRSINRVFSAFPPAYSLCIPSNKFGELSLSHAKLGPQEPNLFGFQSRRF